MKKRIATIIFTVISFVIISSYSVYAENVVFINDNFENLSTSNWIDNTGRGTKTVEQNEDGKYMVLNSTSSYFILYFLFAYQFSLSISYFCTFNK